MEELLPRASSWKGSRFESQQWGCFPNVEKSREEMGSLLAAPANWLGKFVALALPSPGIFHQRNFHHPACPCSPTAAQLGGLLWAAPMSAPDLGNFRSWQISRDQLCVPMVLGHLHMERSLGLHWDLQPAPER